MSSNYLLDKFHSPTTQRWLNFPLKRRLAIEKMNRWVHRKSWKKRMDFTENYLNSLSPNITEISKETGFKVWSPPNLPQVPELINHVVKIFKNTNLANLDKQSKNSFLFRQSVPWTNPLSLDHIVYKVARDPNILGPIVQYLGFFPIINAFDIFYYPNRDWHPKSTQFFHVDSKSTDQVRVFIHINDVGIDNGPTLVFPRNISIPIFEEYTGDYPEDSYFEENLKMENCKKLVGSSGTIVFFDSGRCFHAGGRPSTFPRLLVNLQYVSPAMLQWLPKGWARQTRFWNLASSSSSQIDRYLLGWE